MLHIYGFDRIPVTIVLKNSFKVYGNLMDSNAEFLTLSGTWFPTLLLVGICFSYSIWNLEFFSFVSTWRQDMPAPGAGWMVWVNVLSSTASSLTYQKGQPR